MFGHFRRVGLILFVSLFGLMLLNGWAFGQEEVQTESVTLEDVLGVISGNEAFDDDQKAALEEAFTAVVTEGYLSAEEALALLDAAGVDALASESLPEDVAFVADALGLVLEALYAGEIDPEGALQSLTEAMESGSLNGLKDDLAEWVTPEGISNVIGRAAFAAGYEGDALKDLLDRANLLIADGVPPGIVVRILKDNLRGGTESEDGDLASGTLDTLDELYTYIVDEGLSPGQAANMVAGKGKYKYTEEEQEQNQNQHGKGKAKGKAKGHDKKNDDDE
jgi:hypothetical protein